MTRVSPVPLTEFVSVPRNFNVPPKANEFIFAFLFFVYNYFTGNTPDFINEVLERTPEHLKRYR